jgi:hypothetical protein
MFQFVCLCQTPTDSINIGRPVFSILEFDGKRVAGSIISVLQDSWIVEEKKTAKNPTPMELHLPPEIWILIFGQLSAADVGRLSQCCRLFRGICRDDDVWKVGLEVNGFYSVF